MSLNINDMKLSNLNFIQIVEDIKGKEKDLGGVLFTPNDEIIAIFPKGRNKYNLWQNIAYCGCKALDMFFYNSDEEFKKEIDIILEKKKRKALKKKAYNILKNFEKPLRFETEKRT